MKIRSFERDAAGCGHPDCRDEHFVADVFLDRAGADLLQAAVGENGDPKAVDALITQLQSAVREYPAPAGSSTKILFSVECPHCQCGHVARVNGVHLVVTLPA